MIISIEEFKAFWITHTNIETAKHFRVSRSTVDRMAHRHGLLKWHVAELPDEFTEKQYEVLVGSLLGDGSLSKPKSNKSNFRECHSTQQKQYLSWKNEIFKPFSRSLVMTEAIDVVFPNGEIGKRKESWQCYTLYHKLFAEMENKWYLRNENGDYVLKNGRRTKCLPDQLSLTPLSFAVWFFDDGCNNWRQRNAAISTDGFSENECCRLVELIKHDLSIETKVSRTSGGDYEIYIPARSYFHCMSLISDQIVECDCMNYKFDTSKCVWKQFSQEKIDRIFALRELGWTYKDIAAEVGTSSQYACKLFNKRQNNKFSI